MLLEVDLTLDSSKLGTYLECVTLQIVPYQWFNTVCDVGVGFICDERGHWMFENEPSRLSVIYDLLFLASRSVKITNGGNQSS